MTPEPRNPPVFGSHGLDQPDLDRRPYARHHAKYYIWSDLFGGWPLSSRAFAAVLAGLLSAGACTHTTTRTILLEPPPPNADVGGVESNRGPSTAARLGVPPGHLPDPGECRVWIPGTPPGQQPKPKSRPCPGIATVAPAGSWIIYRPGDNKKVVHVREVDARRPGTVVRIRIFDIETSRLLQEETP